MSDAVREGGHPFPPLHVLTSDEVIARPDFAERAVEVIRAAGARGAFHLRTRMFAGRPYVELARHLLRECRSAGGWLVINGRVDVALVVGADGVQLGRGALAPGDVRRIAPALRIGVSVHEIAEVEDETLRNAHPDWVVVGALFASASHPGLPGRGLSLLREVVSATDATGMRVIGVGGITPERVAPVLDAGADGVAVISGIWDDRDPKSATVRYLSAYADRGYRRGDDAHGQRTRADRS